MRHLRLALPALALATAAVWNAALNPTPTTADAKSKSQTACCGRGFGSAVGLRELDFPYYSLRDGFDSQLNLVSDSDHPVDLTIAIYSQSGATLLSSATIQPSAKLPIDLRTLLTGLGVDVNGDFGEGSMAVYLEGVVMPVAGQVTLTNPALRLADESEMVENDPGRTDIPGVLNGVWWNLAPGRDARIMVANMSSGSVTADVFLDYQGQRHSSAPITFNPHELKLLSVIQLLGQGNASPGEAPEGGITIMQRGGIPKLIAQGKVLDPVTGFSTTLHFPSPELEHASALHAAGIPIGKPTKDSPFAGMGYFIPHVVLRNLTPAPQMVTVTSEYPSAAGWDSTEGRTNTAGGSGLPGTAPSDASGFTAELPLPALTLGGYSTQDIPLDAILSQLPQPIPYGSLRIQYSGAPGSLISEVSSVEQGRDLVIDAKVENEANGWAGSGGNPWHLDNETESFLFLTDMGSKPARIGFKVWAGGTTYYLGKLKLVPHETRMINLRKLRDTGRPDYKKSTIPAGATDGSVLWIRLDNVAVMGRLAVIKRHGGMASSYDCTLCNCPGTFSNTSVTPGTQCPIGTRITDQLSAQEWFNNECGGGNYYQDVTDGSTWSSTNTSVFTVSNSSPGLLTAVGAGTASAMGSPNSGQECGVWMLVGYACQCSSYYSANGSGPCSVISLSQSPSSFNMSTGDT
ncbi:MAG TPA: hypothetical protein VI455_12170, partial [Terriglobia bacterium]